MLIQNNFFLNRKKNWFLIISNGWIHLQQLNWNLHWIIYTNNHWIRGWFVYRLATVVFDAADGVSWNASRHWEDPATHSLSLPHDDCHCEPEPRWRPCMHRRSSLPWQDKNKKRIQHTAQLYFCCHQVISCMQEIHGQMQIINNNNNNNNLVWWHCHRDA